MHPFHIPQCLIHNRNVHISVLNGALWDMEEVHCGICELGQFPVHYASCLVVLCHHTVPSHILFYVLPQKHKPNRCFRGCGSLCQIKSVMAPYQQPRGLLQYRISPPKHVNFKSREISFIHNISCSIISKCYTHHGSIAFVFCAKFQSVWTTDVLAMGRWDIVRFEYMVIFGGGISDIVTAPGIEYQAFISWWHTRWRAVRSRVSTQPMRDDVTL